MRRFLRETAATRENLLHAAQMVAATVPVRVIGLAAYNPNGDPERRGARFAIGIATAARLIVRARPERVRRLVLEDPPIILSGDEGLLREIAGVSTSLKQQQSVSAAIDTLTPFFASYPIACIEKNARDIVGSAVGSWDGLLAWDEEPIDWNELLPAITVPTLVLAPEPTATDGWFVGQLSQP